METPEIPQAFLLQYFWSDVAFPPRVDLPVAFSYTDPIVCPNSSTAVNRLRQTTTFILVILGLFFFFFKSIASFAVITAMPFKRPWLSPMNGFRKIAPGAFVFIHADGISVKQNKIKYCAHVLIIYLIFAISIRNWRSHSNRHLMMWYNGLTLLFKNPFLFLEKNKQTKQNQIGK